MPSFIAERGLFGFAHTQGHIPSGIPYIGHATDAIIAGKIKRAMIIGKGSLFLARLTNLADGASFLIEGPSSAEEADGLGKADIKALLLEALSELGTSLSTEEKP